MIPLNQYTKRLACKVLNLATNLTKRYTPDQITGIRSIDGVAQVRVKDGDRSYVLPFDVAQFKAIVEQYRREVAAAISTEETWERRRAAVAIAVPSLISRLVSLVRYFTPRRRSFIYQVEEA